MSAALTAADLHSRWLLVSAIPMPHWACVYIRRGLVRDGFSYLPSDTPVVIGIQRICLALDIGISLPEITQAAADYEVGVEHLDQILIRLGVLS